MVDYRYETKDEAKDFHKRRKAFIILNNMLEFLPDGSPMSHFEYCQTKGLDQNSFNKITRGYDMNPVSWTQEARFLYVKIELSRQG